MSSYLKKMYLLGKEDEAYNYLNEAFSDEIVRIHTKCLKESNADGEIVYNGVYEPIETAFNKMINITTDEYLQYYQSIGKEIPSSIIMLQKNIKSPSKKELWHLYSITLYEKYKDSNL